MEVLKYAIDQGDDTNWFFIWLSLSQKKTIS